MGKFRGCNFGELLKYFAGISRFNNRQTSDQLRDSSDLSKKNKVNAAPFLMERLPSKEDSSSVESSLVLV